ncbi:dynein heavy chain domain-containing protein 1 isoform X2 [Brachyhypopomus gauderio]|uniref:dynein heavy chain domain-containing protein 1 isoform X2 n=1 Tax=Brachyhypopomus gauderio TaxID=698409 RepID=UPI004042A890
MSASKRDRTKVRAECCPEGPAIRRNNHDTVTLRTPATPSLPPLKSLSPAFTEEYLPGLNKTWSSSHPANMSVVELPQLVAEVGPSIAIGESVWMEGPCFMASALGTDVPFTVNKHPQEVSAANEDVPKEKHTDGTKSGKVKRVVKTKTCGPVTATEVFEIFAKKRHLGELQFYHLKACEDGPFRPYELRVVPPSRAGPDHYIFSPTSVVQVQDGHTVGVLSLSDWHREAVLWKALRDIPFFRSYLLRKGFTRWHRNVRQIVYRRTRTLLHTQLLTAVPHIRDALLHFTRLLEELSGVSWLPQDRSRTYTLHEFQTKLLKISQESQDFLERFLHYRSVILTTVWDFSHSAHQDLQQQVALSEQVQRGLAQYSQQASTQRLRRELERAGRVLHKLGAFTALVDHMIIQGLVTITRREINAFHTTVVKREEEAGGLLQVELMFGADGQLAVCPPLHLLQDALLGALCSVHNSVLQVVDSCSNTLDTKEPSLVCITGALSRVSEEGEAVLTKDGSCSSMKRPCVASVPKLALLKRPSLQVQGQRLRIQCCALSRTQLEWHLQLHAGTQEVEKEQATILQEALHEIHQLCERHSWLVNTYLFTSQWKPASLESMRGWPAIKYEEQVQKVQSWTERVRSLPAMFTTSNNLLSVNCSHIHETLEPILNTIEGDILRLLSEELQLRSENLMSELKKAVEILKSEPTDFAGWTHYVHMVKRYKEMSADMQPQLEYICSLQKVTQLICRSIALGQGLLVQQTLSLWNQFVPQLERAVETVEKQTPSLTDSLDSTFSSLTEELRDLVSKATGGAQPHGTQSAALMNTNLRRMCRQLESISTRLSHLSRTRQRLKGHPLDLTFVTAAKQVVEAHKGLWELLSVSSAQIQEWKDLLFSKFVVSRAQEKVQKWLEQADSLSKVIPSQNAVFQETLHILESFNQELSVLAKLSNSSVKQKHWRNIFRGMGLVYVPEQNLTVADLTAKGLWEHHSKITKVCDEAQAETQMQQEFSTLQHHWGGATFRLAKLILSVWQDGAQLKASQRKNPNQSGPVQHSYDSGTFTIIELDVLLEQTEDSVMTLSSMLSSPHAAEFRQEAEHWVQVLQELEELLDFCERYQKKWVFLSQMFYETFVSTQKMDLVEKFSPVDKTFREMIQITLNDPHVLSFVRGHKTRETNCPFHGQNLRILFIEGLKTMEDVSSQLLHLLDSPRCEFPRLSFLSDGEVLNLLSQHTPASSLLLLVCKCFRGVRWLEVDTDGEHDATHLMSELDLSNTQMRVKAVYGSLMECVPLSCMREPHLSPVVWLGHLEKKLHQTVKNLIFRCTTARYCSEPVENDLEQDKLVGGVTSPDHDYTNRTVTEDKFTRQSPSILHLVSEYPLQCLLVAEEVLWCSEIQKVVLNPAQSKWVQIKAQNAAKLQTLCQAIQNTMANSSAMSLESRRTMTALRALVLLTMKHSQQVAGLAEVKGDLEFAFEWKKLMKYRLSAIDESGQSSWALSLEDPSCSVHVDVLATKLAYGYEYIGPDNWMMVNTPSTDRACLGILLALNSYRCAFISGPLMSGKETTVLQLGWALGQQVVTLGCCANTSHLLVRQMLLGALQTGAWLVLDSVDSMEQGTLSVLGQHLTDIHQCLSTLQEGGGQTSQQPCGHSEKLSPQVCVRDAIYTAKHTKNMHFGGKDIWANLSFGCIIISSHGYSVEVPDNLRAAVRPISLMQPDYSVITEVLLLSFGFSQATNISRQLISLFSLAKDSFCLPDFVSGNKSSWLVLLQKVIDASGTYLYRCSGDNAFLTQNTQKPVGISFTASDKMPQQDHSSSFDKYPTHCSIVNSVREEQAVIRGIMFILFPVIFAHNRASQFRTILAEIFPIARSFPVLQTFIEESDQKILRDAITEEFQQRGFCADTIVLHNAVSLHQTLQSSNAVVLVGPPGSGKTTLYQALAGALRRLAARSAEAECEEDFADPKPLSPSCWCSVDTVVLFPNALSHEQLFGCYDQAGSWRDGAFTKVLRDTEQHDFSVIALNKMKKNVGMRRVKWLVLDGEPLAQSRWFDCLGTLGEPEGLFLYLSSGEKVWPSHKVLKLLIESTSLADANPSILTRFSLVYVSGKDLWKEVWKAEKDALYREHSLDQNMIKMWSCLAEDLFSSTLSFLRQKELNTVMSTDVQTASRSCLRITDGLQEITSFIKILHALLGEPGNGHIVKCASKHIAKRDAELQASTEVQARNLFVVAYIWGFGGHLHPRHWPQFDLFAREALFGSRYRIEVPTRGTVFEHFFNFTDAVSEDSTSMVDFARSPKHSHTCVPQYGKYAYLMKLMLETRQSVVLVGERGSGKTTLAKSLLSQERAHVHLSVSPLLSAADLRGLLERMGSQKTQLDGLGAIIPRPGLVLFLDDLHEAPFDVYGKTSMTLETLRQCISRSGVLTSDGRHFKLFSSGAVGYLGTCSTLGSKGSTGSRISPRLSRLFTVLALPSMTEDILFSFHSTQLQQWLRNFPSMPRITDLAHCIVTATFGVYLAVLKHFLISAHSSLCVFSLHDLKKVFQGMYLWDPKTVTPRSLDSLVVHAHGSSALPVFAPAFLGPAANMLNIARLWMHECLRTFGDRLSSDEDSHKLISVLTQVSEENFGSFMTECRTREHLYSPPHQLKGRTMDHINQSQHVTTVPQDIPPKEESLTSRKESDESPMAEVTGRHSKQAEKSHCSSVEENSSDNSVSSSEMEEDCCSSASSNTSKNEKSICESASSTATGSPQTPQPSSPKNTKQLERSCNNMNQSKVLQEVRDLSDISACEKPQDAPKMPLQLLLDMGSSIRNVIFSPDVGEPNKRVAQHQVRRHSAYLERDLGALVQQLVHIVSNREEADICMPAPCAVYHQRVRQLTHILRTLLIPGGHGVLFGATKKTGRKSTVRLAACLAGYRLIEVHHGNEGKLQEIWNEAGRQIGVHGGHVVFLIHEDTSQAVRDELMVVMATGTFPRHYTDGKIKKYLTCAQRNMHVFLLLPLHHDTCEGQGSSPTAVTQRTQAVALCCCVEVYQPWGSEALVEIASRRLQIPNIVVKIDETLMASLAQAMAGIHKSATTYASSFLNLQPFSLQTYLELTGWLCQVWGQFSQESSESSSRVATVLTRVNKLIETAQVYSEEVLRLKTQYDSTEKSLKQTQKALTTEHRQCERARQFCLLEENQLAFLEEQLEQAEQQSQDTLKEALSQCDLDEVRRYRHPPDAVVTLMDSICMLFNRPCNWESCKQLLGQPSFLQDLEFFDCSKLSTEILQKLSEIVQAPNFQPCAVRSVSRACESLCCWVRAVYHSSSARRLAAPQEALRTRTVGRMAACRARLGGIRLREEAAHQRLEEMERQQQLLHHHLEELEAKLHEAKAQEKETTAALSQVRFFSEKWITALKETQLNCQTVPGDALIVAATISYLGPFGPDTRLDLLKKWHTLCLTGRMNPSPEDPRTSLLEEPHSSADSLFEPIPVGLELPRVLARALRMGHCPMQEVPPALVMELLLLGHSAPWAHHWTLLAHTQQHEELSGGSVLARGLFRGADGRSHKEDEYELVLPADDPELLDKLNQGAKKGLRVLVTHVEQAVPTQGLLRALSRPAGAAAPHPAFRLVLSTALPVHALLREIHPLILEKVKVIDLSLSTVQVQHVILSELLRSESLELCGQCGQAMRDKHTLQDKLHLEEASLMQYILQTPGPLLRDPGFLPHVSARHSATLALDAQLEELSAEIKRPKPLNSYHHLAALATSLYRALEQTERLSPFYHFGLRDFLMVLQQALALKGGADVTRSGEAVAGVAMGEISHRMVSHLLARYRPCLPQSHSEVLQLLASVSLPLHDGGCSEAERLAFLKGFGGVERPHRPAPSSAVELPTWISPHVHAEVRLLDRTSPFRGLVSSLRKSSRQWQEYLRFPSSTVIGPVPCRSHSHLTTLQRAILWRTLFPEWLAQVGDDLTACQHGHTPRSWPAAGPHLSSPHSLSSFLSRNKGPIIVTLPGQSADSIGSIHPLHWIKQAAQYQADKKGVKVTVISFGSECQRDVVLSALDAAVQTGHWLVLNNCHLLNKWDVKVITWLKQLMSCTMIGPDTDQALGADGGVAENHIHPHFRLWFITKVSDPLSVPAPVRIHAVHVACDFHWDLQSELCSSLRQLQALAPPPADPRGGADVEPLLRCAVLHSVLLQRQKLKHLGQGRTYNWSQEDLLSLVDAQVHIARLCTDPTGALEYIAAYLTYGGHVTDSADLEAVKAACRVSLQPPSAMWGTGPHTLAEVINRAAHSDTYSDEEALLRGLERCVQSTLSITEAQALGFSEGMSSEMVKIKSHTLSNLLLQSQNSLAPIRHDPDDLYHAEEHSDYRRILGRLRVLLAQTGCPAESSGEGVEVASLGPLRTFLQTEWNHLRQTLSSMLEEISQPSRDLSTTPYTSSSTIAELETRADLLKIYQCEGSNGSPHVYSLSTFTNPRGFLASLIRETVCDKRKDASRISLHFQVLGAAVSQSSVPSTGVCLCGLELHGALWDTRLEALHTTLSTKPCPLPLLWVRAVVRSPDIHSPDSAPPRASSTPTPIYNCPLYVHSQSKDGHWNLSEENIVTHVPLQTRLDPAICTLRRVRLVSTLKTDGFKC